MSVHAAQLQAAVQQLVMEHGEFAPVELLLAARRTGGDPSRAFDALMASLTHPAPDECGIELRRSLQAIHPGLLRRLLARQALAAPHPRGAR